MIRSLLLFFMLFLHVDAAPCVCRSIGNVTYQNPNVPTNATGAELVSELALQNGTEFMWSNDPAARNWTTALYARPVFGTFVCSCEDVERAPTIRYIVSGVQTDPLGVSARTCLGTEIMTATCATLLKMGLMTCSNTWSSGMSGFAHTAAVETGVLVDAVRRISGKNRSCAETIAFEGALDSVTNEISF
jgi:hypothetical protein